MKNVRGSKKMHAKKIQDGGGNVNKLGVNFYC